MGCIMPKKPSFIVERTDRYNSIHNDTKQYSWSNRERKDVSKYIIENMCQSVVNRMPGQIDGEQFIIQNCSQCNICLMDFSNTVTIDDCKDCTIFVGPVIGSVAVRNCQDCRLMSASQQFRTRDCKRIELFLFCTTQPAIESCYNLKFGCFSANYPELKEQFKKANLNIFNNNWSHVYDFSFDDQEKHWTLIPKTVKAETIFNSIKTENPNININFNLETSLVPKTVGITSLDSMKQSEDLFVDGVDENKNDKMCLVFIYKYSNDNLFENELQNIVQEVRQTFQDLNLLMTKFVEINQVAAILDKIIEKDYSSQQNREKEKHLLEQCQLCILFYQGNIVSQVLENICQRICGNQGERTQVKLVNNDTGDNSKLNYYLSVAFDNIINF